jgi:hypothetical protein
MYVGRSGNSGKERKLTAVVVDQEEFALLQGAISSFYQLVAETSDPRAEKLKEMNHKIYNVLPYDGEEDTRPSSDSE